MKKAGPARGKAKSKGPQASPRGQEGNKAPSTPIQTKDGVPMIHSQGTVKGQKSKQVYIDELHGRLRITDPVVADQVKTRERDAPPEPEEPIEPEPIAFDASEADKAIYATQLQIYSNKLSTYEKRVDKWNDKMRDFVAKEKSAVARIWETVGAEMRNRILTADENITTSNDIIHLMELIDEHYLFTGTETDESKVKKALQSYINCRQFPKETLLEYKRRFDECAKSLADLGHDLGSEKSKARDFFNGLDPGRYAEWIKELKNKESEAVVNQTGVDPYPTSVENAFSLASARVVSRRTSDLDGAASTINANVKGADSTGKKGKDKPDKKGGKPKESGKANAKAAADDAIPDSECRVCDGALNFLTNGEHHWSKQCPLANLSKEEKISLFSAKDRTHAKAPKADGGGKTIGAHVRFSDSDSDEMADFSSAKFYRPTFKSKGHSNSLVFMLDNGANVAIISNPKILTNIRRNPNCGEDPVSTGNGTREFKLIGDSNLFGQVYFDPDGTLNVLPYVWTCENFVVDDYKAAPNAPIEYYSVYFSALDETKFFQLRKNGTYLCDFTDWFQQGKLGKRGPVNQMFAAVKEESPIYSRRQLDTVNAIVHKVPNLGFMSLNDFLMNVKHGHIDNCPYTEEEIRRAINLRVQDVSSIRGKSQLKAQPAVDYGANLGPRELVLHGDLFFLWKLNFLLLVTQPGSYAIVSHLAGGKTKGSLLQEFRNAVAHLKAFGWLPKILVFDGERAITWIQTEIGEMGIETVALPPEIFVHYVEIRIKHIKVRVRCIYSRIKNELRIAVSSKLGKWIVITGAGYTNWIASSTNPDNMPPIRFITGLKIDIAAHGRVSCGDYCEIFEPGVQRNTPEDRTSPALALAPTIRGHWWFLKISENLNHWPVVKRTQFTPTVVDANVRNLCHLYAALHPLQATDEDFDNLDNHDPSTINLDSLEIQDATVPAADTEDEAAERVEAVRHDIVTPTPIILADDSGVEPTLSDVPVINLDAEHFQQLAADPLEAAEAEINHVDGTTDAVENPLPPAEPPPSVPELRRSKRIATQNQPTGADASWKVRHLKTNKKYADSVAHVVVKSDKCCWLTQMRTKQALANYGPEARKALIAEIDAILSRNVWTGVLRDNLSKAQRKRILRSQGLVTKKYNALNIFQKLKARLVAMGNFQDKSEYLREELSSPTVAIPSFYMCLAIAANEKRYILCFDVGTAYLNATVEHDIIMELDPIIAAILRERDPSYEAFTDPISGKILVRLNKALYGCIESARLWYNHLRGVLERLGYVVNPHDICVFNRTSKTGAQSTVLFHVDDGFASCTDLEDLKQLERELTAEFKEVKFNYGNDQDILGMHLKFTDNYCEVTTPKCIQEMLADFEIKRHAKTPALPDLFEIDESSPLLPEPERKRFHSGVQKLLFISCRARMELNPAVSFLTSRVTKATEQDWNKFMRALAYLNHTKDIGLRLGGDTSGYISVNVFADASYGVHHDAKSHEGITVSLGRGSILGKSHKTKVVARSSAEAEVITQSDSVGYGVHTLNFLKAQGYGILTGTIYQDNQAAIRMGEAGKSNSDRTRHIKIRYFFVKQYLDSGELVLVYCPTDKMIADILTKPLQGELFIKLRDLLLGHVVP